VTELSGIEPSEAKSGTLVLVFGKIVWNVDKDLLNALQQEDVLEPFVVGGRALNTKIVALHWKVPRTAAEAASQSTALRGHKEIREAHGLACPELTDEFLGGDHDKVVTYLDGGELVVAMARANPERLAGVMTFLRAPQRQDWFMNPLFDVAAKTNDSKRAALIYDAIVSMPVPPSSNRHRKTYVSAIGCALAAFRKNGDIDGVTRLEEKARMFAKELARL